MESTLSPALPQQHSVKPILLLAEGRELQCAGWAPGLVPACLWAYSPVLAQD